MTDASVAWRDGTGTAERDADFDKFAFALEERPNLLVSEVSTVPFGYAPPTKPRSLSSIIQTAEARELLIDVAEDLDPAARRAAIHCGLRIIDEFPNLFAKVDQKKADLLIFCGLISLDSQGSFALSKQIIQIKHVARKRYYELAKKLDFFCEKIINLNKQIDHTEFRSTHNGH